MKVSIQDRNVSMGERKNYVPPENFFFPIEEAVNDSDPATCFSQKYALASSRVVVFEATAEVVAEGGRDVESGGGTAEEGTPAPTVAPPVKPIVVGR